MSEWTGQRGETLSFEQLLDQVSESILANLIAFDLAGVPRGEVQQVIGSDGGTLIGGGAMFQTPLSRPFTKDQGKLLFDTYGKLLAAYDRGEIAESVVAEIQSRNNTAKKVELIRRARGGS